ncbi:hypothetical protein B0J11DRAFT_138971 [Dendryphion nanum]|uniref:Zn(2)-C6 fungal-type domain-containing protein n=1 Tax=Dendryphion nanum TaxID=256645 RepID=A0A9P9IBR6_9PLEO|nr:hypothetical protein B0J11DRAFT_138971 [Dendryphion nanum]
MVYRGKPSPACGECRKRRNRCDRSVPECGQCRKANRNCPGYRNAIDLMFFDESDEVTRRNQQGSSPSAHIETVPSLSPKFVNDIESNAALATAIQPLHLSHSLDDLAFQFFMNTYVCKNIMNTQFDYFPELFAGKEYTYQDINACIQAIGLVGYARATSNPSLIEPAIRRYLFALNEVNKNLSSEYPGNRDATVLTTLLLAMFEVMIRPGEIGLQNLTKHLNGAMSLIKLRLEHGNETELGYKIHKSMYQAVVMNCWIQNLESPLELQLLNESIDNDSAHFNFLRLIHSMVNFRNALKSERVVSPSALIERALAKDTEFKHFTDALPDEGRFRIMHIPTGDNLTFEGLYHVYQKHSTAHQWNLIRICRIRFHLLVIEQTQTVHSNGYLPTEAVIQIEESKHTVYTLAREICATVPQLAGYLDKIMATNLPSGRRSEAKLQSNIRPSNTARAEINPSITPFNLTGYETMDISFPTRTEAHPSLSDPNPPSMCQLLYQLHTLTSTSILPTQMKRWLHNRIEIVEKDTDPEDIQLLNHALANMSSGSLPFFVNV